jgi:L-fuconolactonase
MTATVDAHHHLIDPRRRRYPWISPEMAAIDRPFGPAELERELAAAGIERSIVIQSIASVDETEELLATSASVPFIAGVVGWVDLTDTDVAVAIDRLVNGTGGHRLVGIRHQVHDEPDPDWLARTAVRRGLAAVEAADLCYDLLVRARELPAALDLARARPGLRLVIDHLAKPPIRSGDLTAWAARIRPFGELPNVWCKLSGIVTEADWTTWRLADLLPAVETALDTLGPERLLFGSDWPVCLVAATYAEVATAARELTAKLSPTERASIFGGATQCVYRLEA